MSRIDQALESARTRLRRLAAAEVPAALRRGALLVDIRPQAQRSSEGEVPKSLKPLVIERNVLEWRCDPTSDARLSEAVSDDVELHPVEQGVVGGVSEQPANGFLDQKGGDLPGQATVEGVTEITVAGCLCERTQSVQRLRAHQAGQRGVRQPRQPTSCCTSVAVIHAGAWKLPPGVMMNGVLLPSAWATVATRWTIG